MRCWCKCCNSNIEINSKKWEPDPLTMDCPVCRKEREYVKSLVILPDFETPAQYEKRTKKKLSDNAAVWIKDGEKDLQGWRLDNLDCAIDDQRCFIIVVQTPEPPPDDYVPEVEA